MKLEQIMKIKPVVGRRVSEGLEDWFVLVEKLEAGEHVRVLPGEIIPMDGVIVKGESTVSLAPLSNEYSVKNVGDRVLAGTYNSRAEIVLEITHDFQHSSFCALEAEAKEKLSYVEMMKGFLKPVFS